MYCNVCLERHVLDIICQTHLVYDVVLLSRQNISLQLDKVTFMKRQMVCSSSHLSVVTAGSVLDVFDGDRACAATGHGSASC